MVQTLKAGNCRLAPATAEFMAEAVDALELFRLAMR
jgi:hypothetical protein